MVQTLRMGDMAGTGFTGEVVVRPIMPEGKRWDLVQGFSYQAKVDTFDVPARFTTDFASVPRVAVWLLPRYGRWTQAAILHDYLWHLSRTEGFKKSDADGIFNRALRELGVPYLRRWVIWAAVRWASGPRSWFAGGLVAFLKMVVIALPALLLIVVPVVAILVVLVIGGIAEFVAYLPLRWFHQNKRKEVNKPELGDLLSAA
jgi:hypothetical protein